MNFTATPARPFAHGCDTKKERVGLVRRVKQHVGSVWNEAKAPSFMLMTVTTK